MSNFTSNLRKQSIPKTRTANGDVSFATTGSSLVDAMADLPVSRNNATYGQVKTHLQNVYGEDKFLFAKMLFWLRDVRGIGQGERKVFLTGLRWLAEKDRLLFAAVYPLIPHYGGWMDVLNLIYDEENGKSLPQWAKDMLLNLISNQLFDDLASLRTKQYHNISLLAKWMPRESQNRSSKTYSRWFHLHQHLKMSPKAYRKIIVSLTKHLNVVETKMSENAWNKIQYPTVASRAMRNYTKAFNKRDGVRFAQYLEDVKSGKSKMNVAGLTPHDIVKKAVNSYGSDYEFTAEYDAHWKSFLDKVSKTKVVNALPIIDTSGSMVPHEIYHAIAFGIATSQTNTGDWRGIGMIFSDKPAVVDLSGSTLSGVKLPEIISSSTDIDGAFDYLLKIASKSKASVEDFPEFIVIFSDMQFNKTKHDKSFFDRATKKFKKVGIKMPTVIFWNLSATSDKPVTIFDGDVVLVGGQSYDTLAYILSGLDESVFMSPLEVAMNIMNNERYDLVVDTILAYESK
jgi:hypothetical protein